MHNRNIQEMRELNRRKLHEYFWQSSGQCIREGENFVLCDSTPSWVLCGTYVHESTIAWPALWCQGRRIQITWKNKQLAFIHYFVGEHKEFSLCSILAEHLKVMIQSCFCFGTDVRTFSTCIKLCQYSPFYKSQNQVCLI